ncbi:MAG: TlpA disulfide reductase family protein [Ferruginibacter sp.]
MKILLSFLLVFNLGFSVQAQQDSLPLYKRFPQVPPLSIITVPDSTRFTKEDLHKKKPVLIIVFSPDCEHCQHAIKDLEENAAAFKKVQVIMVSALDHSIIKKFYYEYNISSYPNIIVGRDANYFLGSFFSITNFPSIFLYDKKGNFVEKFEGDVSFTKIAARL